MTRFIPRDRDIIDTKYVTFSALDADKTGRLAHNMRVACVITRYPSTQAAIEAAESLNAHYEGDEQ